MGYVHVYTGDGKGKTTAALGLVLRAVGAGLRCGVFQFLKNGDYSEIQCLHERFPEVSIAQFGTGAFINRNEVPKEAIERSKQGFQRAYEAACDGEYDLIVLDEINVAMDMGLIPVDKVLQLIADRSNRAEIILTGRNAPEAIIDASDLCTEMRMVKHYYQKSVMARRGIEA